jgi:hypothetical protein
LYSPAINQKVVNLVKKIREKQLVKEATTTLITPDGKTLTQAQKDQLKTAKPGSAVVIKKAGEVSENLSEKKDEADVEERTIETPPEPKITASVELNKHITAAIDAAAKCLQENNDKKYEKVLGKVVKSLTAAQASLADVEGREGEIAEQMNIEDERASAKYAKELRKALKTDFKDASIDKIIQKYNKVVKVASKERKPIKSVAEVITAHALKEGFCKEA